MEIAKSNKEILSCLLTLVAGVESQENEVLEKFAKTTLGSNNSTLKVEIIKYLLDNNWLKTKFNDALQTLKTEDKNPFVRSLLEENL
jgi:hypothetical protein